MLLHQRDAEGHSDGEEQQHEQPDRELSSPDGAEDTEEEEMVEDTEAGRAEDADVQAVLRNANEVATHQMPFWLHQHCIHLPIAKPCLTVCCHTSWTHVVDPQDVKKLKSASQKQEAKSASLPCENLCIANSYILKLVTSSN